MKFFLKIAVLVAVAALCLHAEPISQLHPATYVNDFAGVLDAATQAQLNDLCRQVDQKGHAQIAAVTVNSTDGQDIVSYAVALYQAWGIGPKSSNRGVLILLAVRDHKYWTTVGYGLEPILPDGKVGGFGREAVPLLRNGDYNGAVSLMTSRVASVIAQDAGFTLEGVRAQPTRRDQPVEGGPTAVGVVGFVVVLAIFILVIRAMIRGGGGTGRGGGGSGFWSGLLWGLLLNNLGGGRRGYGGGLGDAGWGGGGFGGGGSGGGDFGGFGGGSTGGGGAGGSW